MFNKMQIPSVMGDKIKAGYFDISDTNEISITDVGFKPKRLVIYHCSPNSSMANGTISIIYDSVNLSSSIQYRFGLAGSAVTDVVSMPYANGDAITGLLDNGFKYKTTSNIWYGRYYYFAEP